MNYTNKKIALFISFILLLSSCTTTKKTTKNILKDDKTTYDDAKNIRTKNVVLKELIITNSLFKEAIDESILSYKKKYDEDVHVVQILLYGNGKNIIIQPSYSLNTGYESHANFVGASNYKNCLLLVELKENFHLYKDYFSMGNEKEFEFVISGNVDQCSRGYEITDGKFVFKNQTCSFDWMEIK